MIAIENDCIRNYIDRIYGYCIRQTYNREEADELSQEILYTALKQLPTLQEEAKFEAWLWGLAANVSRVYRRRQGKQRAMYSFDTLANVAYEDEYTAIDEDLQDWVRNKIAYLSKMYRDIIVLYYYDNLSCREIAERLQIPEGTVTWRLSKARTKLKKECVIMEDTALRPISMSISIQGSGNYNGKDIPFPWIFINDALSQNILYHSYKGPQAIEDLSKLCGVPAFYVEDAVQNLVNREALIEQPQGKYRTNFLIYGEKHQNYNKNSEIFVAGIVEEFVHVLMDFTREVNKIGVYTAGKEEGELACLYGILAMEHFNAQWNPYPDVPYQVRYDGYQWTYFGRMAGWSSGGNGLGAEKSSNLGSGGGTYSHYNYHFGGSGYRPMMDNDQINVCEKLIGNGRLNEQEKEIAANMIQNGYLENANGNIRICIPYFTCSQKEQFNRLADRYFQGIMPKYIEALKKYTAGFRKLFPKNLQEEVDRAVYFLFVNFYVKIITEAQKKGLMNTPAGDQICDVLLQYRRA